MKRPMIPIIVLAGLVAGFVIAGFWETTVLAQRPWQCRSWEMNSKQDDAGVIGTFLGSATNVHLAAAGVSVGSRYAVVACRN